jgi:hypothetical protein
VAGTLPGIFAPRGILAQNSIKPAFLAQIACNCQLAKCAAIFTIGA